METGMKPTISPQAAATIIDSISDGVFTIDGHWCISEFNRAAEEITGIARDEAIGRRCSDVFRASMCETDCPMNRTMETGRPVVNRSGFIIDAEGRQIPISVSTALLRDEHGNIAGGAETFRDLSVVEALRKELKGKYQIGDLVSRSPSMQRVFDLLPQVAASSSTVLIFGETGTGKELLARAIHNLSPRSEKPFIAVNCGALPDTLLESELFGYKAGAFTGANRDKPGRFSQADGGTVFLDEIGDISAALQVRLLRVLQEKQVEPLGGTAPRAVDVRVVAATNRDIEKMVEAGAFRRDLYYRINVIKIHIPPLRERKEDIPLLVDHFVQRFNRIQAKAVQGVSAQAMALLMAHDYPGNVRELENRVEHAFVLCEGGWIEPGHLPEGVGRLEPAGADHRNFHEAVNAFEAQLIRDAMRENNYNRLQTARSLGIHKTTLFRKMKSLGITFPEADGRTRSYE
ncbi:MAG: sigma 54-interacting transcriptional regulator [Desulfobacterales bacterium]|nr:sigma 54-interacting transcriptional regulator [Desulfobacterales bacterium]MBS3754319.1 sigma 54-interacting transcriptional regulator [Desulfobacterales bacterium]